MEIRTIAANTINVGDIVVIDKVAGKVRSITRTTNFTIIITHTNEYVTANVGNVEILSAN